MSMDGIFTWIVSLIMFYESAGRLPDSRTGKVRSNFKPARWHSMALHGVFRDSFEDIPCSIKYWKLKIQYNLIKCKKTIVFPVLGDGHDPSP